MLPISRVLTPAVLAAYPRRPFPEDIAGYAVEDLEPITIVAVANDTGSLWPPDVVATVDEILARACTDPELTRTCRLDPPWFAVPPEALADARAARLRRLARAARTDPFCHRCDMDGIPLIRYRFGLAARVHERGWNVVQLTLTLCASCDGVRTDWPNEITLADALWHPQTQLAMEFGYTRFLSSDRLPAQAGCASTATPDRCPGLSENLLLA